MKEKKCCVKNADLFVKILIYGMLWHSFESENVNYVAAYLAYFQDRWRDQYPEIDGRTAVLATLFNQDENKPPHPNPEPNPFSIQAKKEYSYMRQLLGLD